MRLRCPACKHLLTVPEEYYDRPVRCPLCSFKFRPSAGRGGKPKREGTGRYRVPKGLKHVTPPHLAKPRTPRGRGGRKGLAPAPDARRRSLLNVIGSRRKERASLEAELGRATKIQFNLLPERIPNIRGFDIRVFYQSAKEIGGDYYDFIPIDQENLGMVVADVSGKGVPGAMVMAMTRMALRLLAKGRASARETVIKLNRVISADVKSTGVFVTILFMVLNVRTLTVEVVNAGHNPLILWRGGGTRLVNPKGIAVGLDPGETFENNLKEELIQLQQGDRLCAYTDGLIEAMNERNEEFGEEKFVEVVEKYAEKTSAEFVNQLMKTLKEHQGRAEQHDDITVVTIKYG